MLKILYLAAVKGLVLIFIYPSVPQQLPADADDFAEGISNEPHFKPWNDAFLFIILIFGRSPADQHYHIIAVKTHLIYLRIR